MGPAIAEIAIAVVQLLITVFLAWRAVELRRRARRLRTEAARGRHAVRTRTGRHAAPSPVDHGSYAGSPAPGLNGAQPRPGL